VPAHGFAVARSRQYTKPDYKKKGLVHVRNSWILRPPKPQRCHH
jgi:hypothetical protein